MLLLARARALRITLCLDLRAEQTVASGCHEWWAKGFDSASNFPSPVEVWYLKVLRSKNLCTTSAYLNGSWKHWWVICFQNNALVHLWKQYMCILFSSTNYLNFTVKNNLLLLGRKAVTHSTGSSHFYRALNTLDVNKTIYDDKENWQGKYCFFQPWHILAKAAVTWLLI